MEGTQGGRVETHTGVHDLSEEQGIVITPAGLLQLLPIPERKWESVSMDFITILTTV